jgi:HPt (histidine-containing phosphotransfer) domain-containing protein
MNAPAAQLLNATVVLRACGGDPAMAQHMIKRFLALLPTEQAALETAYQALDWERVRAQAHRLRSGSLYVGAECLAAAAEVLEEAILAGASAETVALAWNQLRQACQTLLAQPEATLLAL